MNNSLPEVLIISKPLGPPWSDGTKVLVKTLTTHLRRPIRALPRQPGFGSRLSALAQMAWPPTSVALYHGLFTPSIPASLVLTTSARWHRKQVIFTVTSAPEPPRLLRALRGCDRIVVLSSYTQQLLAAQGIHQVELIRPGIDPPVVSERERDAIQGLYPSGEGPRLLFAGEYAFAKSHQLILEILDVVVRQIADVRVVIASRLKVLQDRETEAELQAEISRRGWSDRIRFVSDVPSFPALASPATAVIFPFRSLYKKMDTPVAVLECMMLGTPVIVTDVGPFRELKVLGLPTVVSAESGAAFGQAVAALVRDPERLKAAGAQAKAVAFREFTALRMVRHYERLYSLLLTQA